MDTEAKVYEILANSEKPLKGAQISEMAGIDREDVNKAIKALKNAGKIESPKACFYRAIK